MNPRASTVLFVVAIGCGGSSDGAPDAGPMGGTWERAPEVLRGPSQETAAVALDGKIYVIGGMLSAGVGNEVQIFDTATLTWSAGPNLPRAVHHVNAAVVDGAIYVVGALYDPVRFIAIGDTWSWRPATEAGWSVRTPMPLRSERGASVTGVIDGKIYVAGGFRTRATTDVSIYDPSRDEWTSAPPLPVPLDHACGASVGGKLYVVGGRDVIGTPHPTVHELTPGAAWVERAAMPTARAGSGCGLIGDRLFVVGGEGNPAPGARGVFPQVEAYTISQDRWEALAPMPIPRHGMGAAAWNGRLYVPGGADREGIGAVASHEILTP